MIERLDLSFADWFNGEEKIPSDDLIFNKLFTEKEFENIKFVNWTNDLDFKNKFNSIFKMELNLTSEDESENNRRFNATLGAEKHKFLSAKKY